MSFNEKHLAARALEAECDAHFAELATCERTLQDGGDAAAAASANLATRAALVKELYALAYADGASPTFAQQAQRHQALLETHRGTLKRLRAAVDQARARGELLSNVRSDISAFRSAERAHSDQTADQERYYAAELGRVDHQNAIADGLLASANEARAELFRQEQTLSNVNRRIARVWSQIPSINTVLSKINTRQRRNSVILSLVIVFCVLFVLFVR